MKLTVLGATGRTGQKLVEEVLVSAHEVIAVVRDPTKLQIQHEHLTVRTSLT